MKMFWKNIKWLFRNSLDGNIMQTNENFDVIKNLYEGHDMSLLALDKSLILSTQRIKALEERGQCAGKYVPYEKPAEPDKIKLATEPYTHEWKLPTLEEICSAPLLFQETTILQRDPIELFKEDRVPILTSRAITLMGEWGIDTVECLIDHYPSFFLGEHGVGKQTVGYIQRVLGRHGLALREGV